MAESYSVVANHFANAESALTFPRCGRPGGHEERKSADIRPAISTWRSRRAPATRSRSMSLWSGPEPPAEFLSGAGNRRARWHVARATGHHPPPLVQGRYLGVVGDAAGYAHIFLRRSLGRNRTGGCEFHQGPSSKGSTRMNWDRVEGNWKQFKGNVQQQWGKLTNDDLDVIDGKRTELAGRLQQRYGYAKDQAEREIDTWLNSSKM
jgi:uncharacterized protein YjbJ (UPF0337 family)